MADQDARRQIFDMLESGKISAAQAIELIKALGEDDETVPDAEPPALALEAVLPVSTNSLRESAAVVGPSDPAFAQPLLDQDVEPVAEEAATERAALETPEDGPSSAEASGAGLGSFRNWWRYPLWAGVAVTIVGASLMYVAVRSSGFGFWFACSWFPFLFGVAVLALAWGSRQARWLHLRVRRKPGESPQRISISLPLPLRLAAFVIQIFNIRTPEIDKKGLADLIMVLEKTSPETPFYLHVDDADDGEQVEIYIG